ncbi:MULTISPECIES: hypothetical protein [Nocardia]|uniref:hypothetical protein n=1 Tax=Nocardia TaxID=1817 RepID=UPI000D6995C0|nr:MULTISPECIES: hypothetical protein [Nocardia]
MYGIFTAEACVEAQFHTEAHATARRDDLVAAEYLDDELEVHETCDEHYETRADECEDCEEHEDEDPD